MAEETNLNSMIDDLTLLWKQAEKELREMEANVYAEADIPNPFKDDAHKSQTHHIIKKLVWTRLKHTGVDGRAHWRLCIKSQGSNNFSEDDTKPVLECSAHEKIMAASAYQTLKERLLKTRNLTMHNLRIAIESLKKSLERNEDE